MEMSPVPPPYRVGAWLSADNEEVRLLGYGLYVGDEVPPRPMGFTAQLLGVGTWEEWDKVMAESLVAEGGLTEDEAREAVAKGTKIKANPKIILDDGKVVWGAECWWGPEEKMIKAVAGRRVVNVDIDEARSKSE
jgi:hypothetical protein